MLLLALAHTQSFQWLERYTYDARIRRSAEPARADKSIVIIDIDNASFDSLKDKLGRWPWTRRAWTEIVRYLAPGRPKAILFDVSFLGAESPQVDTEFAQVMQTAGNVVVAYSFSQSTMELADPAPLEAKLKLLDREAVPAQPDSLGERVAPQDYVLNMPLEQLVNAAAGMGSIKSAPDSDGTIRGVPLQYVYGSRSVRSLALRVADLVSATPNAGFRIERSRWGNDYAVRRSQRIPVDSNGRMLLRFHGGSFTHERVPLWQVICSIYPAQCPEQKVYFPRDYFKDKIVMVGASAAGVYDVHPMPFAEETPGFVAHLTAIDNLLHGQFIRPAPRLALPLAVVLMAAAGALVLVRFPAAGRGLLVAAALVALYTAGMFLAFSRAHLWLPLVAPVSAMVLSYVSVGALRYATVGRDLRRTRGTLDRYISPALVNYVLDHLDAVNLRGDKRELTILISDVRNFTTWTERSDPEQLIQLLNEYLTAMTEVIFKYDGIVDKFIGDGILAYWGAFTPGENHALLAAQAALEMLDRLKDLNQRWKARGNEPIAIGIGMNTGEVIFGNIGAGKKIEFTVIGDPVNLASRLEGVNKEFHTSIIISQATREKLGEVAQVRALGSVKVKGKTVETSIFELQGLASRAPEHVAAQTAAAAQAD
jgi:adenylate cyclase